jgi:hypothetical protein
MRSDHAGRSWQKPRISSMVAHSPRRRTTAHGPTALLAPIPETDTAEFPRRAPDQRGCGSSARRNPNSRRLLAIAPPLAKPAATSRAKVAPRPHPAWGGTRQREDQADQRGAESLPHEPCGGKNTTGAAGAIRRSGPQDRAVAGRLEQAEPDAADRHPPSHFRNRRMSGPKDEQNKTHAHRRQTHPAQMPAGTPASTRSPRRDLPPTAPPMTGCARAVLSRAAVCRIFGIAATQITDQVEFDPALAIKFTIYRLMPSGSPATPTSSAASNMGRCSTSMFQQVQGPRAASFEVGCGEGFRMPVRRDLSARAEGRRPKAPQEGTRGPLGRRLTTMVIWRCGGLGGRCAGCRGRRQNEDCSSDFVAGAVVEGAILA